MDKFKVFFGHTTALGAAYYRQMCHAYEMKKQDLGESVYMDYDSTRMGNIPNCWEREQMLDPKKRDSIVEQVSDLVKFADITVYQHFINPIGLAMLRMQQGEFKKPILMDLDDYAFDIPSMNAASEFFKAGNMKWKVTEQQLRLSDALIVSTEFLKEKYLRFNKKVYVIPNSIDFKVWDKVETRKLGRGKIHIGHIAASGHADDKQLLKEVIPVILEKYDNVYFTFVGDSIYPTWMKDYVDSGRIKVINHWKNLVEYPQYVASYGFDIGIAPLRDYNFNRGKSNLRYLEYSALKIPTVASNIRPFYETINTGKKTTGYLATESEEWIDALSQLIESKELREEVGLNAYKHVKKNYNLEKITPKYIKLLKKIKEEYDDDLQSDNRQDSD